jgi:hypothetical protein
MPGGGYDAECSACGKRFAIGGSFWGATAVENWAREHVVNCNQLELFDVSALFDAP